MAVSGDLRDMPLTTLISINCNERNQSRLRLRHEGQEAFLFFDKGQLVHMTLGERQGEEIIYELLTWQEGSFDLEMDIPPPAHTVSTPWSNLVLDGMRIIDEDSAGWEADLDEWAEPTPEDILPQEVNEMATTRKKRSEVLAEHLETLLAESADIHGAVIVGTDGLVLASNLTLGGHDATRVGAEGAALLGLSKRTLESLKCGEFQIAILEGKDGWVIAGGAGSKAMVLGLTSADVNLGMAMLEMRDITADVAETLG